MITNAVRLLIICVFAFVPLLLGEFARNKAVNNTNDFILQGRKLKTLPMYATIFSTWMSIFAFIGAIAYFYEQGPIYMTTVGWDALFAVLFILLGRRIWHYGKVHNYMTPTDFFDDIYDSKKLNVLVTVVSILSTMVYLQVQIVGGILVMNVATAGVISSYVGGIIFFSILVIYLWAGGLRAVVMTDIFYGILIVLAIVSSGLYLMHVAGGTGQVFPELIAKDPSYVSMPGEEGRHRVVLWISLFFIVPIGAFMGPQIWIRNYAAESERNFNVIPWLLCLSSIICVGTLFAGSSALVLTDHVDNPDSILLTLLHQYANPFFYTFVIIGIYATIFSTANSQVHAIAAVYTIDVHKRYIKPEDSGTKAGGYRQVDGADRCSGLIRIHYHSASEHLRSGDHRSGSAGTAHRTGGRSFFLEAFYSQCCLYGYPLRRADISGRSGLKRRAGFQHLCDCRSDRKFVLFYHYGDDG